MEKPTLTPNQKARISNINAVQMSVGLIGLVAGIVYAKKTGGGFWRYVGWSFAGSIVAGLPAQLIATPIKNKILREGDTESANKEQPEPEKETKELKQ